MRNVPQVAINRLRRLAEREKEEAEVRGPLHLRHRPCTSTDHCPPQSCASSQADHPLHALRVDGRPCSLSRNDSYYYSVEHQEGLVPWDGNPDILIDRFDARALLDAYALRPTPAGSRQQRHLSSRDKQLEAMLAFESYRDLVRLMALGLAPQEGIMRVQEENVAVRAQARTAAAARQAQTRLPGAEGAPVQAPTYAAVGFSYGNDEEAGVASASEAEEDSEHSGDEEAGDEAQRAADAEMDAVAVRMLGLEDFSSLLRWSVRQEEERARAPPTAAQSHA